MPEDAVRERRERRRHACMKGALCGGLTIGWKTEASGRAEGRAGRRRPREEGRHHACMEGELRGAMLAPLKG